MQCYACHISFWQIVQFEYHAAINLNNFVPPLTDSQLKKSRRQGKSPFTRTNKIKPRGWPIETRAQSFGKYPSGCLLPCGLAACGLAACCPAVLPRCFATLRSLLRMKFFLLQRASQQRGGAWELLGALGYCLPPLGRALLNEMGFVVPDMKGN